MDSTYDSQKAADQLEIVALERLNSPHSGIQISRITSVTAGYEVVATGSVWRLVHRVIDEGTSNEEVVALFQGIICKEDLPPFTERLAHNSGQARYLQQGISITGLQSFTFDKIVHTVAEVHAVFGRAVGNGRLDDCIIITSYKGMPALQLSNRYFTPCKDIAEGDALVLSADIDPYGHLATAAGLGLCHTEENVVLYFERRGTNDDNYKYIPAKPVIFGVGDIVEVQVSFMAVPLRHGRFKTTMVLRGITLVDGTFTQQSRLHHVTTKSTETKVLFKRKVGYLEEEVSVTNAKMSCMEIDKRKRGANESIEGGAVGHGVD